jgi:hypothetical protein
MADPACPPTKESHQMTGRRAVAGLMLLSAFLLWALAAQSASASVVTSKNTTAFTCVEGKGSKDFADAHCDQNVGSENGKYGHVSIPLNETTGLDATNQKVTNETKTHEPAVIKGTVGLGKVEISCTVVKANTKESAVHNVEPELKQHTFTGLAVAEFSECTVNKPEKCTIKEPIVTNTSFHGVEGLEGPKSESNAMGVEYIGTGPEETFAEIQFENKGAESCSLNGIQVKVKGKVYGTSGPTTESVQTNKSSGATIAFTPKFKMQELKMGKDPAEFTLIATPLGPGGIEAKPISITTAT